MSPRAGPSARGPVWGLVLAAVLLGSTAPAAAAEPAVSRQVLSNGMTVLVRESQVARVVTASLQVAAGSGTETEQNAGVTSFVQRMLIRGTARRSMSQVLEAAEEIGGALEASGDVDHAELRGQALARHWERLLSLMAEAALEPAFGPDEVERERRVILGEIQTRSDNARAFAMDALLRDLYGPHPYGLPTLGWASTIERLRRDDLVAHYREIYRPNRVVLAVSGDVVRERVVRAAERLFARWPRAATGAARTPAAPAPTGERRVLDRPAQQAQVLVGFLGPSLKDPEYPAVKLLSALLGGGMGGRLFVEVRDKRGLAYSLGVLNPSRTGPSAFMSYLGTAAATAEAAEGAVLHEMERTRGEPPTEDEIARARAHLLGSLAMDRRTNARQAFYLAFFELLGAGWDFPERYARTVERVTGADLVAVGRRYLVRPTTVVLRPTR